MTRDEFWAGIRRLVGIIAVFGGGLALLVVAVYVGDDGHKVLGLVLGIGGILMMLCTGMVTGASRQAEIETKAFAVRSRGVTPGRRRR